jgi:RNA polymerase sigma-70 factor (ECF subfamily)
MRAFQHLGSYHGDAQFGTWLSRIAYRCSINYLRKRKWDNIDIDEQKLADISDEQASEALQVTDEERKELLRRAIQMLRPEDRSLIMMFYFDNRTMREIVYILDMSTTNINKSINTLAARITRIRKKLYLIIKQLENENG